MKILTFLRRKLVLQESLVGMSMAIIAGSTLCFFVAKLWCLKSALSSEVGSQLVFSELGLDSLVWFADDLLAALMFGIVGTLLLWPLQKVRKIRLCLGLVLLLLLSFGCFLAVEVYFIFGTFPTLQLTAALGSPDNATDSVKAMLELETVLRFLSIVGVGIVGYWGLQRMTRRHKQRTKSWIVLYLLLTFLLQLTSFFTASSRLELDRNSLLEFTGSVFWPHTFDVALKVNGKFTPVLEPILGKEQPSNAVPYAKLKKWSEKRPNVIFVILETTATRYLGLTGGEKPNTPNLNKIASQSLFWSKHYTHTPGSMIALYQLLCGNHNQPQKTHISATRPQIDCHSLSEILVKRGYKAGLFHSGKFSYSEKDRFLSGRGYQVLYDTFSMPNAQKKDRWSWGIREEVSIEALLNWMEQSKEEKQPLFATYIPVYPHHPYKLPSGEKRQFGGKGDQGRYVDVMFYMDRMIGELLSGLKNKGLLDNTLLVIVGDHGEGFGEHPGSHAHGRNLYDEAMRSFVLWYAPGALNQMYDDKRVFGHVDVLPTLLDILGIEKQKEHSGNSANQAGKRPMVPIYTGYGHPFVGFVDWPYKYILNRRTKIPELYNLVEDPLEKNSLVSSEGESLSLYKERAELLVATIKKWEDNLPDLQTTYSLREGEDFEVIVNPANCEFPSEFLREEDGLLFMFRPSEQNAICEIDLPAGAGQVVELSLKGNEGVPVAIITGTLAWQKDGVKKLLAYCALNGNDKKPAKECLANIIPEQVQFKDGGKLLVDLRYVITKKDPVLKDFHVSEVKVKYRIFDIE